MSISADNRTVIITGASSGIRFALAEAYLEKGCNVVGNARTIDRLKKAAEKLRNQDNFLPVDGDISLELTARKLFERAIAAFGKVDILINNAGIFETLIMPRSSDQPSPGPILPPFNNQPGLRWIWRAHGLYTARRTDLPIHEQSIAHAKAM